MTPAIPKSLLACAALGIGLSSAWAKPPADIVRAAANSVVRVTAEGCPGEQGTRVGSGFVWPDPAQVVTALHLVADCQTLTVEYVDQGVQRRAQASKSLRHADLALLQVDNPPAVPALSQTATAGEQEDLAAISLPLNVNNWQETYGAKALNVRRLSDILNDATRREIERLGAPAIDLEIFRLTAVVKPGSSGGPVINAQGHVVGIVDGGLDGGASSLNWAVPAHLLQELLNSGESGAQVGLGPAAETVFAFSVPQTTEAATEVNRDVVCGGRRYFHLATRRLDDIVGSVQQPGMLDDPNGFLYVVNTARTAVPVHELDALRFDLFVDAETGATVAVPDSMTLSTYGPYCLAESDEGDLGLGFYGEVFNPALQNFNTLSHQFNLAVLAEFNFSACQTDPAFTQLLPHSRFDGLVAQRSAAICVDGFTLEQTYLFAGNLSRLNTFLGVVAYNEDFNEMQYGGDPDLIRAWAAAAIAVMISTYQI